jgi:hypothetical protein
MSASVKRGKYRWAKAMKSSSVVMFWGTNCEPSFAVF